jgi:predicted ATPase
MAKSIKLHIKDFGPIHEADLDIKPLTVFIGRNDTGKSYAAMLLYSLMNAYKAFYDETARILFLYSFFEDKAKIHEYESIKLDEYIKDSITVNVTRLFDSKLEELINRNSKDMKMQFTFKVDSKGYNFSVRKGSEPNIQLLDIDNKIVGITRIAEIAKELLKDLELDKDIILLPSSRSGLLQTYHIIAAESIEKIQTIIQQILRTGLTDTLRNELKIIEKNMYLLPFHIVQFIYLLLKYSAKEIGKNENEELIKRFEEILGGKIMSELGRLYFHDERYGLAIDINKASSGIQELTPLYLVIKHFDLKNIMLIIEEPEAHLHPELIINMTRVLAWLVRKGAYVIITTHSDYLLHMLNILIRLNKVDENKRVEWKYTKDEYLKPDEVSAYLFKYSQELRSSIAEKLTIEEEGIPEDEFTNVIDELTKTHIKIDLYEGR